MNKSAIFSEAYKKATDLFDAGMYRKALSKFETALTAAQDDDSIIDARLCVIDCYQRVEGVSIAQLSLLGRKADFCSLSIRRFCVAASSWSLW